VNLGLACLSFLLERFKPEGIANSGINVKTKVIYQFLGYTVAEMRQYYLANPNVEEYRIASLPVVSGVPETGLRAWSR
jgi:hypothetical protein